MHLAGSVAAAFYSEGPNGWSATPAETGGCRIVSTSLAVNPRATLRATALAQAAGSPQVGHCEWSVRADTWEWDPDLFDVFGVRADQVTPGWPAILSLKHPDDLPAARAKMQSVQGGMGFMYSNRIFRNDGYVRRLNVVALLDLDSKGTPAAMRATIDVLRDWEPPLARTDIATASDGDLMLGLRAQSPDALTETFQRHSSDVSRVARQLLRGSLSHDDIVDDVFERLFRSPGRFDARRGSLRSYLMMEARTM